ncbi:MAG: polysaccharide deacetylase family protein [Acidobacteria bacterium]|nr:polysaccharide deacetylase family protein [Acidobacteriota bacterium]MBI3489399.1 polysaccharide deacetylase family protein [Acidobacteriota bacterium]
MRVPRWFRGWVFLVLSLAGGLASGADARPLPAAAPSGPRVLAILNVPEESLEKQVNILAILLGHFSTQVTLVKAQDFVAPAGAGPSHVVYFGGLYTEMPGSVADYLQKRQGRTLVIGNGIQRVPWAASRIIAATDALYDGLQAGEGMPRLQLDIRHLMKKVEAGSGAAWMVHAWAFLDGASKPFCVSDGDLFYLAPVALDQEILPVVGETLFAFFDQSAARPFPLVYLRLEDIHPNTDARSLLAIGTYLKEKKIPYMAGVIPTYRNPETGRLKQLSEAPGLVKALRFMQENGASIILHGHTHQYRNSETGEGFEFWDVESDRPVYQDPDEPSNRPVSAEDLPEWLAKGKAYEQAYVRSRVRQGVRALAAQRLYPLAFEAPHYAMSQAGYRCLSEFFSTYVGHLQVSDTTWRNQVSTLHLSRPAFLNGMAAYPENLGFVPGDQPEAAARIRGTAMERSRYRDALLGVFYHPYLGLEKLKGLITELEKVPGIHWVDLKREENWVRIPGLSIQSSPRGIFVGDRKVKGSAR